MARRLLTPSRPLLALELQVGKQNMRKGAGRAVGLRSLRDFHSLDKVVQIATKNGRRR